MQHRGCNIQNEMIEEATKQLNDEKTYTFIRRDIGGVEIKLSMFEVRTNSKRQVNKIWYVNDKKTAAAKVQIAFEEALDAEIDDIEQEVEKLEIATQPDASFAATYSGHRQADLSKTAALRATAKGWGWTRKEFLSAAEKYGINRATAATQWQQGRKG